MKKALLTILFATFCYAIFAKNVVITGKVSNPKEKTVVLIIKDIIKDRITKTTRINKEGEFRFEYEQKYAHDNYIKINDNIYTIFISPDDTLHIELVNNQLIFTGRNSRINTEIQNMPPINLAYPYNSMLRANSMVDYQNLNPNEHKQEAFKFQKEYLEQLRKYNETQNTSPEFREWSSYSAKYYLIEGLMNTMAIRQYYKKSVPDDFYDFLNDPEISMINTIPLNLSTENTHYEGNPFISSSTHEFGEQYLMYLLQKNKPENSDGLTKKQSYKLALEIVVENSSGKLREIIVTKLFYSLIMAKEMDLVKLYLPFFSQYIANEDMQQLILSESRQLQELIENVKIPDDAVLKNFEKDVELKDLMAKIIEQNKGKIIYIDIWATWCAPCLAQIPYSKKLQDNYSNKNVAFVYLCYPTTEEIWKTTIGEIAIGGQHYLLSKDQYNLLCDDFQISGIPHYVLIDKEGTISERNAPNPESDEILEDINKLLGF